MVMAVLRNANPALTVELVHAGASKAVRAEPVAALAERGLIHHVGEHVELEDQLLTWSPGQQSPDRLDAFVHACAALIHTDDVVRPHVAHEGQPPELDDELWSNL